VAHRGRIVFSVPRRLVQRRRSIVVLGLFSVPLVASIRSRTGNYEKL
jgi:hypothetical protein